MLGTRLADVTASARSLPLSMCGPATTVVSNIMSTWPAITSWIAGRAALVRDVRDVDAGLGLEQLEREVLRRAAAGRSAGQRLLRLARGDHVLQRLVGARLVDDEHRRVGADQRDRRERLDRVVADLRIEADVDRVRADRAAEDRVAVGRGARGDLRADAAAGAALVVDDDRRAEHRRRASGRSGGPGCRSCRRPGTARCRRSASTATCPGSTPARRTCRRRRRAKVRRDTVMVGSGGRCGEVGLGIDFRPMSDAVAIAANANVAAAEPRAIRMDRRDNVAIVANEAGLDAGAAFTSGFASGLVLTDRVPRRPQGRADRDRRRRAGAALRRRDRLCGRGRSPPAAGSTSGCSRCPPRARSTACRSRPSSRRRAAPLEGYTFEGYRNADGSVGTRNILAITTTVQCVAGVVEFAVAAHQAPSCCRSYPNVDDVVGARAHLRLRRRHRRARRGDPDPHAAQHQPATRTSAARSWS